MKEFHFGGVFLQNLMLDTKNNKIDVTLFGSFSICYQGNTCISDTKYPKKVVGLIQYLILHRNHKMSNDQIIHDLEIDHTSNSPSSALKNLIYRARILLKKSGLPEFQYIVQDSGVYAWNSELPCVIDTECFEEYYKKAVSKNKLSNQKRIQYFEQALCLYRGTLLPKGMTQKWFIPFRAYFKNLHRECLVRYYEFAKNKKNNLSRMIEFSYQATRIDPFDEKAYGILISSYYNAKRYNEALEAYEEFTDHLYDELGVKPSDYLVSLYEKIMGQLNQVEKNLMKIDASLREIPSEIHGAYYCTFGMFKAVAQFTLRLIERTGQSLCMVLFTITDEKENIPEKKKRNDTMYQLKECISISIRSGDVFARYSPTQYIIMLIGANYENSGKVSQRILDKYRQTAPNQDIIVTYKVKVMERCLR